MIPWWTQYLLIPVSAALVIAFIEVLVPPEDLFDDVGKAQSTPIPIQDCGRFDLVKDEQHRGLV